MKETIEKIIIKTKIAILLIIEKLKEEPVLVRTALGLLVGLGLINLTSDKIDQIEQIVLVILILLGSTSARKRVKPLTDEELDEAKIDRAAKRIERVQKIKTKINQRGGKK